MSGVKRYLPNSPLQGGSISSRPAADRNSRQHVAGKFIYAIGNFVPVAAAYAAGDLIGAPVEFVFYDGSGDIIPPGSGIRILSSALTIPLSAVPSGQTTFGLPIHTVTPPTPQADNAPWVLIAGQVASYLDLLALGAPVLPVAGSAALTIRTAYTGKIFQLDDVQSSIWGRFVTDGGHTIAETGNRTVKLLAELL